MATNRLTKDFTSGSIAKHLLWFMLPFMASNALQVLYSTIDMVIVGEYVGTPGLSAVSQSTYAYIAEQWISYLADEYTIPREEIRIVFQTDDNHVLTHAEIALKNCYYAQRQAIEADIRSQTELPLTVKGW